MRIFYAVIGAVLAAVTDLTINLIAAGIQERGFWEQYGTSGFVWLAVITVAGLLVGLWLGEELRLPAPPTTSPGSAAAVQPKRRRGAANTVTMTRLRALLSYAKLRGRGIHLSDILLIGARVDIDTGD